MVLVVYSLGRGGWSSSRNDVSLPIVIGVGMKVPLAVSTSLLPWR
jgi:hypothetical protein